MAPTKQRRDAQEHLEVDWFGVFPALTTQFQDEHKLDVAATVDHARMLVHAGVHGLVLAGTLGEGPSLNGEEKARLLEATRQRVRGRVPVLMTVAETTTAAACDRALEATDLGADGLMVLPALVYSADRREAEAHFRSVAAATSLPVMVYNNPVSYGVDLEPESFAELSDCPTLVAIKESSDDVRRITDLIALTGDRYRLFCGVDDLAMESLVMGADGWVAGMVNAYPRETVALWDAIHAGQLEKAKRIYRWFAPLLHLDTEVKLVQYIKLAVEREGFGSARCRPPRLELEGEELRRVSAILDRALADRPRLD